MDCAVPDDLDDQSLLEVPLCSEQREKLVQASRILRK